MPEAKKTNAEIRRWYLEQVGRISHLNREWLAQGLPARERAKRAWRIRHGARLDARAMMADAEEAQSLRGRDLTKYGNPDGPTFEYLVRKYRKQGLKGNAVYEAIIKDSYRTDERTDERFR